MLCIHATDGRREDIYSLQSYIIKTSGREEKTHNGIFKAGVCPSDQFECDACVKKKKVLILSDFDARSLLMQSCE